MDMVEEEELAYNLNMALFRGTDGDHCLKDFLFLAGILKYPEDWSKGISKIEIMEVLATGHRGGLRTEEVKIYLRGWKMLNVGRPASFT
jgi:hypothetical protein